MIGEVPARRATLWRSERLFFPGMAIFAIAIVFAGFARTYFLRSYFQPQPLPLYLKVHGLLFTAWIGLFLVQTSLVAAGRTDIHRRLGWAGAALAAVMVPVVLYAA